RARPGDDHARTPRGARPRPDTRSGDAGREHDSARAARGTAPAARRGEPSTVSLRRPRLRGRAHALPGARGARGPSDARRHTPSAPPGRARLRAVDATACPAYRDGARAPRGRAPPPPDDVASARSHGYGRVPPPSETMSSRLGDFLHRRGDLTAEHLKHALEQQREQGGALATHLVRLGYI